MEKTRSQYAFFTKRVVVATASRTSTSEISRFLVETCSCWRTMSIPKSRSSGWVKLKLSVEPTCGEKLAKALLVVDR